MTIINQFASSTVVDVIIYALTLDGFAVFFSFEDFWLSKGNSFCWRIKHLYISHLVLLSFESDWLVYFLFFSTMLVILEAWARCRLSYWIIIAGDVRIAQSWCLFTSILSKYNIPMHLQFMFKSKSRKGSVWISVMKWTQICGRMRWEDGPQNIPVPPPPKEIVLRIFWCTPML